RLFPDMLAGRRGVAADAAAGEGAGREGAARAALDAPEWRHLESCAHCELEYRLFSLSRDAMNLAACPDLVEPDRDFFKTLRARMARGPEVVGIEPREERWAAALLATARQLIPVMAFLLLLIIGATLMWNSGHPREQANRQQEAYEIQEPSPDD